MDAAPATEHAHHNPFEVLELGATATSRDVSRQKDKLLGMLELGLERAKRYTSSLGDRERTADLIRSAAQELERPRSRLTWELWLPPSDEDVGADPDAALMRRALVLHHQLLKETSRGIAFGVEEIDDLGTAWDEVLASDGLYDRITDRASELELDVDESEVFDELRAEIREQMRTMFEHGPAIDLDALTSEIASEVAHEFADRKVELLELACSQITRTRWQQAQRQQQWNGLVREYASSVTGRGEHFRRAAFQAVSAGLGDLAVDLFNEDIDHTTALSMFRWLRDEASNLGDDDLVALHGKNVATVQGRIARDEAAIHAAYHEPDVRSSSGWDAFRVIGICIGVFLALLRAGNACRDNEPSFTPPSYEYSPSRYQLDPELYRDLQRIRQDPDYRRMFDEAEQRQDETP